MHTYVHALNPFAIQFTEHFGIRWYGLAYLAGFVCGYLAIVRLTKRGGMLFKVDEVADFITYVAIGVLVGGRLGYCVFYAPELWTSFDGHFPYWGVLKVNEGGMASHGGIIGVMVVCWLYGRVNKLPFLHCLDATVFGGSLGFFFGRIANFINGELYGREASPTLAWAVKFPSEMSLWIQRSFNKLYELKPAADAMGELVTGTGEKVTVNATIWQNWLENYGRDGVARQHVNDMVEGLILAVQNGNAKVTEALAPVLTPRHPSQLYQCLLEGLLVFLILCWIWRKPQKPGVVSGWFGTLYCVARIIGEQFRMPDAHIGFQLWGLTRGQWLSIAMLSVGIAWLIFVYRRDTKPLGGWNPRTETVPRA